MLDRRLSTPKPREDLANGLGLDECPETPDRPEQRAEYSQPLFSVSEWHDLSLKGKALSWRMPWSITSLGGKGPLMKELGGRASRKGSCPSRALDHSLGFKAIPLIPKKIIGLSIPERIPIDWVAYPRVTDLSFSMKWGQYIRSIIKLSTTSISQTMGLVGRAWLVPSLGYFLN